MAITDLFGRNSSGSRTRYHLIEGTYDDVPPNARLGLGTATREKGSLFTTSSRRLSFRRRLGFTLSTIRISEWTLLTLLGVITALVAIAVEYCVAHM